MTDPAEFDAPSVLFASTGFSVPGGISNLAGSMLAALDELSAAGRLGRVDVISLHDAEPPPRSQPSGRSTVAASGKARFVASLLRLLSRDRPGLIIFDHVGLARAVQFVPPRLRPPFGIMVHGVELEAPTRKSTGPLLRNAALVLANSQRTAARAAAVAGVDLGTRLQILNPCVSRASIDLWSRTREPQSSHGGSTVLIAGRLEYDQPGKGHEALIEAWPAVTAVVPGARLVVAGDGNKRLAMERLATDRGVANAVEFVGYVPKERLGELYRSSTVYAMPSRQEGFGIVFAEAMWHGLPCIGSTSDAAAELIEGGVTGFLVPYGDPAATAAAVVGLLTDDELARRMGRAGRERCLDLYSPDVLTKHLLESIKSAR